MLCFNTSYVSVQVCVVLCLLTKLCSFNTSYVSVQDWQLPWYRRLLQLFQYILCFGSREIRAITLKIAKVSIHPMFRFKHNPKGQSFIRRKFQYILCFGSRGNLTSDFKAVLRVSIHPMFRFKRQAAYTTIYVVNTFQYILCFGSSKDNVVKDFNTLLFQYILCFGSSICLKKSKNKDAFQYILCFGSSLQPIFSGITHNLFQYILCFGSS